MKTAIYTAPTVEPLRPDEALDHLRITTHDEDAYVAALITTARQYVEKITGRALITQTWDLALTEFDDEIALPYPPLQSITSITYYDGDGVLQTLANTVYEVDTKSEPGILRLKYNQTWPGVRNHPDVITVRYACGYGAAASNVPVPIIHAMKLLIAHWYETREPVNIGNIVNPIPMTVDALLAPYTIWSQL